MNQTVGEERAPLSIGAVSVSGRAFLAPMSGVTDAPFRRVVARLGAGIVVSEMTACEQLVRGDIDARRRLRRTGEEGPHVVQLAGCDPHWMAEGARIAEDAGADIIDINMGCPARKVTNGYAGSALMRDLDHALGLVDATVGAVTVPVTLKMRLGWDEQTLNAPDLARRAEAAGVRMITVHGRTRCQFYKGSADWNAVQATRATVGIPVVVNGDISGNASAKDAIAQADADAVMIGRAAIGRPWLVGDIAHYLATGRERAEPSLRDQHDILLEVYEGLLELHGVAGGVRHARKHLRASLEHVSGRPVDIDGARKRLRTEILTSEDPVAVKQNIAAFYAVTEERRAA